MSCYHPLIGIPTGCKTVNGKEKLWIRSSSQSADFQLEIDCNKYAVKIPCQKCIGCRLDLSRQWADRMILEMDHTKKGIFVTLTYDNEHIPICQYTEDGIPLYGTLDVRDCQLFLKRLRKYFTGKEIRFYLAGEYGSNTLRPHYHAILFGLGLDDFYDLQPHGKNELGQQYFISNTLAKIWNNGFVLLSDVSWKTCAYVARYVTKKWTGPYAIDYAVRNCMPEFSLMSRRPGIAGYWLEDHGFPKYANISVSDQEGSKTIQIPKYFLSKLELIDPESYVKLKEQRKEFAEDRMILKLQKTGLSYLDYLEVEENKKLDSCKALRRDKVQ